MHESASQDAVLLPSADEALVPRGTYLLSARLGGAQHLSGFSLDRYPVTVERYAAFVAAGGYEERDYWEEEGWAWKERSRPRVDLPRFWDEPGWARFVRPARPVVGVSWFEAQAFCRFAGRRLPGEQELEAAARGPLGRRYTWGEAWEEGRLGVRGVGPRMTWPVGQFRSAVGPFGHHDLLGSVWQWTCTADAGGAGFVARGGSWASRPDQNTTESWNVYPAGARFSHLGFRTAAVEER